MALNMYARKHTLDIFFPIPLTSLSIIHHMTKMRGKVFILLLSKNGAIQLYKVNFTFKCKLKDGKLVAIY